MQALVRVQARVRARRLQLAHDKLLHHRHDYTNQLHHHHGEIRGKHGTQQDDYDVNDHQLVKGTVKSSTKMSNDISISSNNNNYKSTYEDNWDGRRQSFEQIKESSQRKHDAAMRRERALAYAYNAFQVKEQQYSALQSHPQPPPWGWHWPDNKMTSQPFQAANSRLNPSSYASTTSIDDIDLSERTVEMDIVEPTHMHPNVLHRLRKEPKQPSQTNVPSYMAPTQSAKAKAQTQGAHKQSVPSFSPWNNPSSTGKRSPLGPNGGDTSSSASETTTHQYPSSNSGWNRAQKNVGGYSPDSIGSPDHRMFGYN